MTIQQIIVLLAIALILSLGVLFWLLFTLLNRTYPTTTEVVEKRQPKTPVKIIEKPRTKYANSKLSAMDKNLYVERLIAYLEKEKSYRQSNLTIDKLAKELQIPKYYLSQVINEIMGCSFLDFINQYRVQEAQEKLQSPILQKETLIEIGKQVGFNSKSTFYSAFKKYTHTSPGEYRKANQSPNF